MTSRQRGRDAAHINQLAPWSPDGLAIRLDDELASWRYVVLEELVDSVALLRRWPWPSVDPLGRLVWSRRQEQDTADVAVAADLLQAQLYAANGLQRSARVGDVFATHGELGPAWRSGRADDVRRVFAEAEVYDITVAARAAAKIALHGSLGAIEPASNVPRTPRRARQATSPSSIVVLARLNIAARPSPGVRP